MSNRMTVSKMAPEVASACRNAAEALALLAEHVGFTAARQVAEGIWNLGSFRNRAVFYAETATAAVGPFLVSNPRSFLIFGSPDGELPKVCENRSVALSELLPLDPFKGRAALDRRELDRLAKPVTAGLCVGGRAAIKPVSGLPLRLVAWKQFLREHYEEMRREKRCWRPRWDDIWRWFAESGPASFRAAPPGIRTLKRDAALLTRWNGQGVDQRDAEFLLLWLQMEDEKFVFDHSQRTLPDLINGLFGSRAVPPSLLPKTRPDGRPLYDAAS